MASWKLFWFSEHCCQRSLSPVRLSPWHEAATDRVWAGQGLLLAKTARFFNLFEIRSLLVSVMMSTRHGKYTGTKILFKKLMDQPIEFLIHCIRSGNFFFGQWARWPNPLPICVLMLFESWSMYFQECAGFKVFIDVRVGLWYVIFILPVASRISCGCLNTPLFPRKASEGRSNVEGAP